VGNGIGIVNQVIDSSDGFASSSSQVSFTLTNTSGTWASVSNVLTPNSNGFQAEAHIFVTANPAVQSNGASFTGFAGNGPNPVPEPSTLAIAGLGALGFIGFGLRRRLTK
jgi:hypothetical protein